MIARLSTRLVLLAVLLAAVVATVARAEAEGGCASATGATCSSGSNSEGAPEPQPVNSKPAPRSRFGNVFDRLREFEREVDSMWDAFFHTHPLYSPSLPNYEVPVLGFGARRRGDAPTAAPSSSSAEAVSDTGSDSASSSLLRPFRSVRPWAPAIDVSEDKQAITVHADLPGLTKDEVSIDVKDHVLKISGHQEREEARDDKDKKWHYVERASGYFERRIQLPRNADTDNIKATYKDGVLSVAVPKKEHAEPEKSKIQINFL